jgi:hypothetical protein
METKNTDEFCNVILQAIKDYDNGVVFKVPVPRYTPFEDQKKATSFHRDHPLHGVNYDAPHFKNRKKRKEQELKDKLNLNI